MFALIKSGDFETISNEILKEREQLQLSPFINLAYLKAEDSNPSRLRKFLVEAKKTLSVSDIEVYGPFESFQTDHKPQYPIPTRFFLLQLKIYEVLKG